MFDKIANAGRKVVGIVKNLDAVTIGKYVAGGLILLGGLVLTSAGSDEDYIQEEYNRNEVIVVDNIEVIDEEPTEETN